VGRECSDEKLREPSTCQRLGALWRVGQTVVRVSVSQACQSTVMNGAVIGAGSLVAAGALVLEGTVIPPHSLVAGVPAKVRRETTADERADIIENAVHYRERLSNFI